jgi:hypothetical protein
MLSVAGRKSHFRVLPLILAASIALPAYSVMQVPAFALSELQQAPADPKAGNAADADKAAPAPAGNPDTATDAGSGSNGLPMPEPLIDTSKANDTKAAAQDAKPGDISMDIAKAPEPVRKLRQAIMDAARAGDLAKVASLMDPGPNHTDIGPDDSGNDLQTALKDMSGDGDGLEILSIMLDLLSTGYAHVNVGTPDEAYVWPYFTEKKLDTLTPSEKVDLMRIVTAGDFADMLEYGGYNFYRIGITPDGHWKFFLSGN